MSKILKCSVLHTRELTIQNCKDPPQYCKRTYQLFIPEILCSGKARQRRIQKNIRRYAADDTGGSHEGEYHSVGTIPMVFALHGFGRDHKSMSGFAQGANDYHFLLILPEGVDESWNAGSCCGDAQTLKIHDDDFLHQIQQELSDEFNFLQPQYSYGIGWDNGALLLTEALISYPNLFRAIVPISGLSARSWIPPSIGSGIGLMMHYSLDDLVMRPSGCCDDPNMPTCQSDFKVDKCVSFLQSFDLWARGVNLCDVGRNENLRNANDPSTILMGGQGDHLYSLFHKDGETSMELISAFDDEGEDSSAILSKSEIEMIITQQREEYVCLATTSSSCVAPSTICVYRTMGHFDGFISTPFMSNHVMKFLANDACSINDGLWNAIKSKNKKVCGCAPNGFSGVFCLDETGDDSLSKMSFSVPENTDTSALGTPNQEALASEDISSARLPAWSILLIGAILMAAAVAIFTILWMKHRKESDMNHNDNKTADILRGYNPYRDHLQVKTKDSDGRNYGMLSLPNPRMDIHQPFRRNSRSLENNDMELLEFYRRKRSGESLGPAESVGTLDNATECNFDKELLDSYRRREQMKQQYADKSSDMGGTTRMAERGDSIEGYLFNDIPSYGNDAPGIKIGNSDGYIKSIMWDE